MSINKLRQQAPCYVFLLCWGLATMDPHHVPFVQLLNALLELVVPKYQGFANALLIKHNRCWLGKWLNSHNKASAKVGLACRQAGASYLLTLACTSGKLGNALMGHHLGCLVAKAIVAMCRSPCPPVENAQWLKTCIDLLLIQFTGSPPSDPDHMAMMCGLPQLVCIHFDQEEAQITTNN